MSLPVGRSPSREAFGLVTGLPFSAAFRMVFAFQRTTAAFLHALLGGLHRLSGLPSGLVFDNGCGVEREQLRPLPGIWPDVDARLEVR